MSPRQLTAEQLDISQSRKQQSQLRKPILHPRQWLSTPADQLHYDSPSYRVKVLSWNLLAQCLIRRELFPASSCLKANQREPMIHEEIIRQDADILCLQEVDRIERLLPVLNQAGYSHIYASGPHKLHGCLIAFKKNIYTLKSHKVVYYDDQDISLESPCRGSTFKTKNIASLVALHLNDDTTQGIVVATTHLFWHPCYTYERIRQLGILIRETNTFRQNQSVERWPCVIAGDFNFTPKDAGYSLLFGDPLLSNQEQAILDSRVIHATIDPTVPNIAPTVTSKAREDDDEASDPDRIITNARPATPKDGLLTIPDIVDWFSKLPKLRSAYCEGLRRAKDVGIELETYGTRELLSPGRKGFDEPEYTSYTFYWKSVLDYIFFMDIKQTVTVTGLAKPPSVDDLDPGIPKNGVSGSDHTALIVEITWQLT